MPVRAPVLSTLLLDRIDAVLGAHQILHGQLVVGQPRLNLHAWDSQHVFVKINRLGERATHRAVADLSGARWAARNGIDVAPPRLSHPVEVSDEDGHVRDLTIWAWVHSATGPALYDQARILTDLLLEVSHVSAPAETGVFDLDFYHHRIHDRLGGSRDGRATALLRAADETAAEIRNRLNPARYRWLHGDLHLENVLWRVSGTPVLLDWESNTVGPLEWDVAQLLRSIHLDFPAHTRSAKDRAAASVQARLNARVHIDWALVAACMRFRAASSGSHRLIHGHDPVRQELDQRMSIEVPFPLLAA